MGVVQDRVHVPTVVPANGSVACKIFPHSRDGASSSSTFLMLPGGRTSYS